MQPSGCARTILWIPGNGLLAITSLRRDVPEAVVDGVESKGLTDNVGSGLSSQFRKCWVVVLLVEQCVRSGE